MGMAGNYKEPTRDPACGGVAPGDQAGYPCVVQGTYSFWVQLNQVKISVTCKTPDFHHAYKKQ